MASTFQNKKTRKEGFLLAVIEKYRGGRRGGTAYNTTVHHHGKVGDTSMLPAFNQDRISSVDIETAGGNNSELECLQRARHKTVCL